MPAPRSRARRQPPHRPWPDSSWRLHECGPRRRKTPRASWFRARRRTPDDRSARIWPSPHNRRETPASARRVENIGVGQHQIRLVKHSDQVLAVRGIDSGLPPHGRIHLRKQAGRHLHKSHSAPDNAGGKARQVTDHAATKRQHNIATLKPRAQNVVAYPESAHRSTWSSHPVRAPAAALQFRPFRGSQSSASRCTGGNIRVGDHGASDLAAGARRFPHRRARSGPARSGCHSCASPRSTRTHREEVIRVMDFASRFGGRPAGQWRLWFRQRLFL
jgi:hypothetical protein